MGKKTKRKAKKSTAACVADGISYTHTDIDFEIGHYDEKRMRLDFKSDTEDQGTDSGVASLGSQEISCEDQSPMDLLSADDIKDEEILLDGTSEDMLMGHLTYDSKNVSVSSLISGHSDSAIIKSEIFDPAFDIMQQTLVSSIGECDITFSNGVLDPSKLLNVSAMPKLESTIVSSEFMVDNITPASSSLHPVESSIMSTVTASNTPSLDNVIVPTCVVSGENSVDATKSLQPIVPAAVPVNSVTGGPIMIPTTLIGTGPTGTATTAFAQVAKIEQAADGKGYILHLNIPAFGLGNVVLSTQNLAQQQQLQQDGQSGMVLAQSQQIQPFPGVQDQNYISGTPIGLAAMPGSGAMPNNILPKPPQALPLAGMPTGSLDVIQHMVQTPGIDFPATAEDLVETSDDLSGIGSMPDEHQVAAAVMASDLEPSIGSEALVDGITENGTCIAEAVNVGGWVEKPEVDRFVICSDGPMECMLCAFKTESYSAFKSHIICSHPCWRITKKLSKNRLLVEKSVKMNVNLVPAKIFQPPKPRKSPPGGSQVSSGGGGDTSDPISDPGMSPPINGSSGKSSKKLQQQQQRKKQMLERNKRLFRCSMCLRLFVFEGSIVNHLIDYHEVKKPYDYIQVSNDHGMTFGNIHRCSHKNCFVSCASEEELERHRFESHAQVVYRCQICGYTADSTEAVKQHAMKIHRQQVMQFGLMD